MSNLADVRWSAGIIESRLLWLAILLAGAASPVGAASVFTTRPDDPGAVCLTAQDYGVRGDGVADDGGVWRAVRVIGYGQTRPVFVLADNTPGSQKGIGLMVMFTHGSPPGAESAGRAAFSTLNRGAPLEWHRRIDLPRLGWTGAVTPLGRDGQDRRWVGRRGPRPSGVG